jgi:putative oxidoreductase
LATLVSSSPVAPAPVAPKVWNAAFWSAQVLLAALFGMAGLMKLTAPLTDLVAKLVWPGAVPEGLVRFIGAAELTGAVGLLLPALTRIQPRLTGLAALGLVLVMALAVPFHLSRGELQALGVNLPLGALALFVAWGRLKKAPLAPRA